MKRLTLALLVMLAAACGASPTDEAVAPMSSWKPRECTSAGSRAGVRYRVCYASPTRRAIERFRNGRFERVDVADPTGAGIGHWRWAALSPDGSTLLAQWSAECEVPFAFLVPADGGVPGIVTGERDWTEAPESEALGWTTDGRPIVHLPKGACGRSASTPGTYVLTGDELQRVDATLEPSLRPRELG